MNRATASVVVLLGFLALCAPAPAQEATPLTVTLSSYAFSPSTITPNKPGTYDLDCTHFVHSALGMTGKIVVQ